MSDTTKGGPPAGFYDDPDGSARQRWYDGTVWTDHYQTAAAPVAPQQPIQVAVAAPVQTNVKQARDKAQYVRQQTPHSLTKYILLSFIFVGIPGLIYYSASPNHYWKA